MARQKTKKTKALKRYIDKLWQTGNYWQWLKEVEAEDLEKQYPQELDQAWKALIRKALRMPGDFEEFTAKVGNIQRLPEIPDLRFLMALGRLVEDDGAPPEIAGLKGLSPAAAILRERALGWNDEAFSRDGLNQLLKTFSERPGTISKRHYDQLAEALQTSGLAEPVKKLGEMLPRFRQLNHQSNVKKGWKALNFSDLKKLDRSLNDWTRRLPDAFSRVLLLPFCNQVATLIQRLATAEFAPEMTDLVGSFPFLFPLVAGDRAEEASRQLALFNPKGLANLNLSQVKNEAAAGKFEDNLVLLNNIRRMLTKESARDDSPFDFFAPFRDTFNSGPSSKQRGVFRALYDSVLGEIKTKAKDLPSREVKELRRVMEKVLINDLPFMVEDTGDAKEMAPLLKRLMEAGCVDKRLALLTLLVAGRTRSASLLSAARDILDQSAPVEEKDLRWLLEGFEPIYFPRFRALVPLLDRFRNDTALFQLVYAEAFAKVEGLLIIRSIATGGLGLVSSLLEMGEIGLMEDFYTMRQELDELKGYQEMEPVRFYVSCFPQGRITRDGFLRWLDYVHAGERWADFLKGQFQVISQRRKGMADAPFGADGGITKFLDEQVNAVLVYLKEHSNDFMTMEIGVIEELVALLPQFKKALKTHSAFLIRLSNILDERCRAGEEAAGPPQKELLKILKGLAASAKPKKTRQTRRRRT